RIAATDDLVVDRAVGLHLDPREVLLVEHVEADALGIGRQVELHRNGYEPELDRPFPHRARHACSSLAAPLPSARDPGAVTIASHVVRGKAGAARPRLEPGAFVAGQR